jgi:hypothetical protein
LESEFVENTTSLNAKTFEFNVSKMAYEKPSSETKIDSFLYVLSVILVLIVAF